MEMQHFSHSRPVDGDYTTAHRKYYKLPPLMQRFLLRFDSCALQNSFEVLISHKGTDK